MNEMHFWAFIRYEFHVYFSILWKSLRENVQNHHREILWKVTQFCVEFIYSLYEHTIMLSFVCNWLASVEHKSYASNANAKILIISIYDLRGNFSAWMILWQWTLGKDILSIFKHSDYCINSFNHWIIQIHMKIILFCIL